MVPLISTAATAGAETDVCDAGATGDVCRPSQAMVIIKSSVAMPSFLTIPGSVLSVLRFDNHARARTCTTESVGKVTARFDSAHLDSVAAFVCREKNLKRWVRLEGIYRELIT